MRSFMALVVTVVLGGCAVSCPTHPITTTIATRSPIVEDVELACETCESVQNRSTQGKRHLCPRPEFGHSPR